MTPVSILVVGSHRIEVGALGGVLGAEPGLAVIGTASSAGEALSVAELHPPDVAVIDTLLGPDDAMDLTDRLIRLHPDVRAVVLIDGEDPAPVLAAVLAGATAVVVKPVAVHALAGVILGVAAGETHIPPRLLTGVLAVLRPGVPVDGWAGRLARLTQREQEVLREMAEGRDTAAIAERLFLSPHTVRTHVKHILAKLGVHSSVEAVSIVLRAQGPRPPAAAGPVRSLKPG
jgi:DNA-binding NarL/FixJ family response regulator